MKIINIPSILKNFGKYVNFRNFQNNCRMNSEIRLFISTFQYKISVLFHTFLITFGKITDSQSLNTKNIV